MNLAVKEFTKHAESLVFYLSKGLSCPIESVIAGNDEFITRTRNNIEIVGGGMWQADVIVECAWREQLLD